MKLDLNSTRAFVHKHREYFIASAIYLVIALIMFWNITANIAGSVVNGGGDVYQSLWGLWWVPFSTFVLHQSAYFTSYILYPVGANLVSQTMVPLAGILTAPLQVAGLAFTYNFLLFTSFMLSGLFMYMLAKYLTKNMYAAFIAGLIFAFSPMHIAQSYSHLQWTIIEFIPLFTLFFLMALREHRKRYAILAGVSFVLLTFAGDIEQGIMMVFFVLVSLVLLLILDRKEVLNRKSITNLGIMAGVAIVLSLPFLLPILSSFTSSTLNNANQLTDTAHNLLYSANIYSFLLPSYYNGLFHGLSLGYYNQTYGLVYLGSQYSPDATEKIAYLGYSVLILGIIGLFACLKKNRKQAIFWSAIFVIFVLMALGPLIQLSGTAVSGIPSLYALYKNIPLFNLIREPGRFDVIVTLALAIFAALGVEKLYESNHANKNWMLYVAAIAIIILIEYNGMPLSASFANSLTAPATIPLAYSQIGKVNTNFTILNLPALPNATGSYLYPGVSMFYGTAARKPVVGGYATRMNATQEASLENIPLIVSSSYLQDGQGLVFPYPIHENYTALTTLWLTEYNVGFVSVLKSAYTPTEFGLLESYLDSFLGSPIYQDNNVTIFSTTAASAGAGKTLTSYAVGTWLPGYTFCSGSSYCNPQLGTAWWGDNLRAVTIFSPQAQNVTMQLVGLSYYPLAPVSVYDNGKLLTTLNFTNETATNATYSLNVGLAYGFNQVEFYESNQTLYQQNPYYAENPYINYGIRNITFLKTG